MAVIFTDRFAATRPVFSGYAERAYFTKDACQHCADRDEHRRVRFIERRAQRALFGR